jgi:pimeloyl-ACP methyl ester carboxylesterase
MTRWRHLDRNGICVALASFGGKGQPVLFLHGLAGHAEEWQETADWLIQSRAVFGLDLRGHGRSERRPRDVSVTAHAGDVIAAVNHIGSSVVLIGHSIGGVIAMTVAASRPDLIARLVVSDASAAKEDAPSAALTTQEVTNSLRWPIPFKSQEEAIRFFNGPSLRASAWVAGLEQRDDGLWPRFELPVMIETLREFLDQSYWNAWDRVECPTLLVRADSGVFPIEEARAMVDRLPTAELVEIRGAQHDLHLDQPLQWREELSRFLGVSD